MEQKGVQMTEFLQSYGIWVFSGVLFLMMFVDRGRGGCCGMPGRPDGDQKSEAGENGAGDDHSSPKCH